MNLFQIFYHKNTKISKIDDLINKKFFITKNFNPVILRN